MARPKHYCSFCGKSDQEVASIVVAKSGDVAICNECATQVAAATAPRCPASGVALKRLI